MIERNKMADTTALVVLRAPAGLVVGRWEVIERNKMVDPTTLVVLRDPTTLVVLRDSWSLLGAGM